MAKRTVIKNIMVDLNEKERLELGSDAGRVSQELEEALTAFDHIKKEWKGKIEKLSGDLFKLHKALREKRIEREMSVEVVYNGNKVTYLHKGAIVEERPMTDDERQTDLED